jgi:rod shape-determining protein MreC
MRQEISERTHIAVVSFCLFVAALFLTAYSSRYPTVARVGNSIILEVTSPIARVVNAAEDGAESVWNRYLYLISTARENEVLSRRVHELETKLGMLRESETENARLRAVLSFSTERALHGTAASVIGADASGWIRGLLIDRGTTHGLRAGMAVVHPRGVVGQITSVGSNSARVLLVNDHSSGVDVLIQGSRVRGVLEGAGEKECELKFVTKDNPVKVGDVVVTSGMDQVFPKGLVVGSVSQVSAQTSTLFQTIAVRPAVDFTRVEEVVVVPSGQSTSSISQGER